MKLVPTLTEVGVRMLPAPAEPRYLPALPPRYLITEEDDDDEY